MEPWEIRKQAVEAQERSLAKARQRLNRHFDSDESRAGMNSEWQRQEARWQQFCRSGIRASEAEKAAFQRRQEEAAAATARFSEAMRGRRDTVRAFRRRPREGS